MAPIFAYLALPLLVAGVIFGLGVAVGYFLGRAGSSGGPNREPELRFRR